jgi:hypothetical protein
MKVWLTRKLADEINGIDLRGRKPGDVLDLPAAYAHTLIAEDWALPERRHEDLGGPRRRGGDVPKRNRAGGS